MTDSTIYFYGPLRVIVDTHSGRIVAVQCRTDLAAAEGRYRPAYVAQATAWASRQHAAAFTEG